MDGWLHVGRIEAVQPAHHGTRFFDVKALEYEPPTERERLVPECMHENPPLKV